LDPNDRQAGMEAREILYESERCLVFRRHARELGRPVICKRPLGPAAAHRLQHERRILERLAGIEGVPVLAPGLVTDGSLTFEDPIGTRLHSARANRRVTFAEAAAIGQAVAGILAAIHRRGVLHKDINPSNILLCGEAQQPMVIDYDLATTFAEERPAFTHHSEITGTLAYLAPEQSGRMARAVDQRTDLYSLGATLYELVVGDLPFRTEEPLGLIRDHLATVPPAPAAIDPAIPATLSDIIMLLLEKEPDDRYQSAEGLAHDLARLNAALACGDGGSFPLRERDFSQQLTTPRLIGRDAEVATMRGAFEAAVQGDGGGILVAGAPGVGKTALIERLRPIVTARRGWFVYGKVDQFRHDTAAGPITQAIRGLGRMLLAESPADVAVYRARILAAMGDNVGFTSAVAPEFPALLGSQPPIPPGDAAQTRARGITATLALLRAVASPAQPVVMVLDDLQWADPITIDLFQALLANSIPGLFVIGACRPAEVGAAHRLAQLIERQGHHQASPALLHLANLPPADISTLLGEMLRLTQADAARLARSIGAQTDGNPFETMELVNALRRDGLLTAGQFGWEWDDAAVRWHSDHTDAVALLTSRIANLPEPAPSVIAVMACLGGVVELGVLDVATGLDSISVRQALVAPLEEGLLVWSAAGTVLSAGPGETLRFRHDRVHQAAYDGLEPDRRAALHLAIARRLAVLSEYAQKAAEQYLPAVECVLEEDERRRAVALLHKAAAAAGLANVDSAAERLLAAAIGLFEPIATAADQTLLFVLRTRWHQALCGLGRQQDADGVYAALASDSADPMLLVAPARLQISGLANRNRHAEALALGFGLLARLGLRLPDSLTQAETERGMTALRTWIDGDLDADARRPEIEDPRIRAAAYLISIMVASAYYWNFATHTLLIFEGQRLWVEYGPCGALAGVLSCAGIVTINLHQDYRVCYRAIRHVLAVGEARQYEPATSQVRHMLSRTALHWFDDLELVAELARNARLGLLHGGELQIASFTYYTTLTALLEYAPVLDRCEAEADLAVSFALRTGNHQAAATFTVLRQVPRALRGRTVSPGSLSDADFNESRHLATLGVNRLAAAYLHVYRALTAALFDDDAALIYHAAAITVLRYRLDSLYPIALAYVLQGLALARRLRTADEAEQPALRDEFSSCQTWLARRAADSPGNFLHLVHLLDAELAWASGDYWAAQRAFETGIALAHGVSRPWHQALLTERSALLHLEQGLGTTGNMLIVAAYDLYQAWGADAKLLQIQQRYGTALAAAGRTTAGHAGQPQRSSSGLTSDTIDLMGILRASQALSSETVLDRLHARVSETLGALTGATSVRIVLRDPESESWYLPAISGANASEVMTVAEAGQQGVVPLSAFHCVQNNGETLIVEDATRDDRFARDPYFAGVERCSLLVVPIRRQGVSRAMLLLENRLSRGAFSSDRLDAVSLVAGQLAVSLDNALMYASLENKVAERTRELREANQRLEALSISDPLTGLANRRRLDEVLQSEWLRALRGHGSIGVVMIDIDHFKRYNDHYGHVSGDSCLCAVATALQATVRQGVDFAARYGGEEFILVLPDADAAAAVRAAERAHAAVLALREPHAASDLGYVTISVGVAALMPTHEIDAGQLIELADAALYDAKQQGRNRVTLAGTAPSGVAAARRSPGLPGDERSANAEVVLRDALFSSRQRWRELATMATDFGYETDDRGCFTFITPDSPLGWVSATQIGQQADLLLASRADGDAFNPFRVVTSVRRRRVWIKRADGSDALLAFTAVPLLDAKGNIAGARGVGVDWTDNEAFHARAATMLRRGEMLNHIIRRMGHEVDAPRMMNAALVGLMNSLGAEGVAVIGVHSGTGLPFSAFRFGAAADALEPAAGMLGGYGKVVQAMEQDARPILVATCLTRSDEHMGLALWRESGSRGWDHEDELLIGAATNVVRVVLESPAVQDEIARQVCAYAARGQALRSEPWAADSG
jgi:diguanylate cyclase (GGDEF)-like protein